jgi:site-specific recombinase XerD
VNEVLVEFRPDARLSVGVYLPRNVGSTPALFSFAWGASQAGGEINQSYVRHLLRVLLARQAWTSASTRMGLRHAFAVELEREGAPISTIRDLLGHASAATTDRYLRRLGAGEAAEFSRRRDWALA